VVVARLGLPLPFRVAVVAASALAAEVTTVGADGVTKLTTVPKEVPTTFEARAQT
jgi:hypothetical protein